MSSVVCTERRAAAADQRAAFKEAQRGVAQTRGKHPAGWASAEMLSDGTFFSNCC